jgi:hypothetical protein
MDSKWSDADGKAQVRFRSGGASVDDVSPYSNKTSRAGSPNIPRATRGVHVRVFHVGLKESGVAGSPRIPCSNVNRDEAGDHRPVPRCLRGRLFDQLLQFRPGNGYSLVIVLLERRIVFSTVDLIIGHLKQTLKVHIHGALMTNYALGQSATGRL